MIYNQLANLFKVPLDLERYAVVGLSSKWLVNRPCSLGARAVFLYVTGFTYITRYDKMNRTKSFVLTALFIKHTAFSDKQSSADLRFHLMSISISEVMWDGISDKIR